MANAKARRSAGGPSEDVLIAHDPWCGRIAQGLKGDVETLIARHFEDHHPQMLTVLEGSHYTIDTQPLLCDACCLPAELPYWTHVSTPKTNVYDTQGHLICSDSDGLWLICDACHEQVLKRQLVPWLRRVMKITLAQQRHLDQPGVIEEHRAHLARVFGALIRNLDGGTRNTLQDPGPLGTDADPRS
jgi:hypothetical protein